MNLMGVTPSALTSGDYGVNQAVTGTSTAAVELPKKIAGVLQPDTAGTSTGVVRYASLLILTALGTDLAVSFGGSGVAAAAGATGFVIPAGGQLLFRRPQGTTHYRVISQDETSEGVLGVSVLEWESLIQN